MNYPEVIQYLYSQLPVFQNQGASALNYKLDKITQICNLLGNPQNQLKCVHTAGTNGKGSTSHFIASILQENKYKVGLYTSPHLKSFTERIRINGYEISEAAVVDFVTHYKHIIEDLKPSFFEWTVALAFYHFAKEKVDIAIIEVGMGGRLDSTNIITPLLSVITNIGLDHEQFLGTTLPQIAREKAGIIKENVPVLISETQTETTAVFKEFAIKNQCKIKWVDQSSSDYLKGMTLSFPDYLYRNAQTACHAVVELEKNGFTINYASFLDGLLKVTPNTGLKGRWQILNNSPLIVCDTGHNKDGVKQVVNNLKQLKYDKLHIVFGVVKDKEVGGMLALLPKDAIYYWCSPAIERGLSSKELKNKASEYSLEGNEFQSVQEAINQPKQSAQKNEVIFIGGSNFVVAEIEDL